MNKYNLNGYRFVGEIKDKEIDLNDQGNNLLFGRLKVVSRLPDSNFMRLESEVTKFAIFHIPNGATVLEGILFSKIFLADLIDASKFTFSFTGQRLKKDV